MTESIDGTYEEVDDWRILRFEDANTQVVLKQPRSAYAMITVAPGLDEPALEQYYGLEYALDHAAAYLNVPIESLSVPEEATAMEL